MISLDYNNPLVRSISLKDAIVYLKKTGWEMKARDPQLVFEGKADNDGEPIKIVLSHGKDPEDVHSHITEMVSLLCDIERRSPFEVIKAIRPSN